MIDHDGYGGYLDAHDRTTRTPLHVLGEIERHLQETGRDESGLFTAGGIVAFASWLKSRNLAPRSRATYLSVLSGYLAYCARVGRAPPSPTLEGAKAELHDLIADLTRKIEQDKKQTHTRLPPTDAVEAIIRACDRPQTEQDYRDRAVILTLLSTGARIAELCALRNGDLDARKRTARIVRGKGGKARTVYLSRAAWDAISRYHRARAGGRGDDATSVFFGETQKSASPRCVQRLVSRKAEKAGVSFHITPHGFRHYVATRFLEKSGNLAMTQEILGHANPHTTTIYAAVSDAQTRAMHESLFEESDAEIQDRQAD